MKSSSAYGRALSAYARFVIRRPLLVLITLSLLGGGATWEASKLTINSNQLDLISQKLPEVKAVKRVIDMIGGAGYFIVALKSDDQSKLEHASDDIAAMLKADTQDVRTVIYRLPIDFLQKNIALFLRPADLKEAKRRINAYLQDQIRRNNPFYIEVTKTPKVKLDLSDLIAKYDHVGQKDIRSDYYLSDDGKMAILLVKPTWDDNKLEQTEQFAKKLDAELSAYSKRAPHGFRLVKSHDQLGKGDVVTYGYAGMYMTSVDDAYAVSRSLEPVSILAFVLILGITLLFFRKLAPTVIVLSGVVLGTLLTMGFTKLTVGELNLVTSILGGILMGFGVDYGIHFVFRTRLEMGEGKPYDEAIHNAVVKAGRPASVAAVVTGGAFAVLMISQFRGFSQFGFLAASGTVLIGFTLFSWSPAWVALLGRINPEWPKRFIGTMRPKGPVEGAPEPRIPHPGWVLAGCAVVVAAISAFAVPWKSGEAQGGLHPNLLQRLEYGVRFNYDTRSFMPDDEYSVQLQDEIDARFHMSSVPIAVRTDTLAQAKAVYDEVQGHPKKYSTVSRVLSIFSFVPPPKWAAQDAKILAEWQKELKDIDLDALPAKLSDKAKLFNAALAARPFGVEGVPTVYEKQFQSLASTRPENRGWLTFLYPALDLYNGRNMLKFAAQIHTIHTEDGQTFYAAGSSILYSKLTHIVFHDAVLTLVLTTLWILLMHFWDFRSVRLALASVLPLGVGLVMMLGLMSLFNERLNVMNIVILPILLGFGISHGLYLLHRFLEGTSPIVALRSVGAAVAASTLTAIAGFGALLAASHGGIRSMGLVACLGLSTTLLVSFTVLAAVLQILHDQRTRKAASAPSETRKAA